MTPCDTLIPYPKVHNPINKMQCAYSFLQRHLASSEDDAYILRTPTPIYLSPLFACVNDEDATGKFARDPAAVGVYIRRIGEDLAKKRSELNTLPIFFQNTTIPSIQQLFPAFITPSPVPSRSSDCLYPGSFSSPTSHRRLVDHLKILRPSDCQHPGHHTPASNTLPQRLHLPVVVCTLGLEHYILVTYTLSQPSQVIRTPEAPHFASQHTALSLRDQ